MHSYTRIDTYPHHTWQRRIRVPLLGRGGGQAAALVAGLDRGRLGLVHGHVCARLPCHGHLAAVLGWYVSQAWPIHARMHTIRHASRIARSAHNANTHAAHAWPCISPFQRLLYVAIRVLAPFYMWSVDAGTDIKTLDVSKELNLVVTGGDDCSVSVFNYPCVTKDAPNIRYEPRAHFCGAPSPRSD
jgi:hypothetical protein